MRKTFQLKIELTAEYDREDCDIESCVQNDMDHYLSLGWYAAPNEETYKVTGRTIKEPEHEKAL